jgi:hypothetical protein
VGPSPAALLYSCTLAADVTTDPSGRIVDVTLLKIESSIQGIGVALRAVGPVGTAATPGTRGRQDRSQSKR